MGIVDMSKILVVIFAISTFYSQSLIAANSDYAQGKKAYADKVVSYSAGNPQPKSKYQKKKQALGKPDFNSTKMNGFVSLGCKGSLTVQFTNNVLFDDNGADLLISEVGPASELTTVEISENGSNWINVGSISGNKKSIDLKGKVAREQVFHYVRLTDQGRNCSGDTPGADIDAVIALNPSLENRSVEANTTISQTAGTINNDPCAEDKRVCDADGDSRLAIQFGGDDCDDNDAGRFPGNVEVADQFGKDEDCDPTTFGFADHDGDGFHATWAYNIDEKGERIGGKDCDDKNPSVNPNAYEICDNVDNNCSGIADDGLAFPHFADKDRDRLGDPKQSKMLCDCDRLIDGIMWVTNNSDCNDSDPTNKSCSKQP